MRFQLGSAGYACECDYRHHRTEPLGKMPDQFRCPECERSKFEVGNWAYCHNKIFRVGNVNFEECCIQDENLNRYSLEDCVKLSPLTQVDIVIPGEEIVCIQGADNYNGTPLLMDGRRYIVMAAKSNSSTLAIVGDNHREWLRERFAKIPRDPCDIDIRPPMHTNFRCIILPVDDAGHPKSPDSERQNFPCPHPEWCGIWDYCGDVYRITWNCNQYLRSRLVGDYIPDGRYPADWSGPGEFWKMIEPEPLMARSHPPIKRLNIGRKVRTDYIKTPWDPCQ